MHQKVVQKKKQNKDPVIQRENRQGFVSPNSAVHIQKCHFLPEI